MDVAPRSSRMGRGSLSRLDWAGFEKAGDHADEIHMVGTCEVELHVKGGWMKGGLRFVLGE